MTSESQNLLRQTISTVDPHDHICMIYDTPEQEVAAATLSIEEGLRRGEKCFYVIGENSGAREVWTKALENNSEFQVAIESGQLQVVTSGGNYIRDGQFDPDQMITVWEELFAQAQREGYPSMRILGDPAWAIGNPTLERQLIEYESKVNTFFEKHKASAICLYNRKRYSPHVIRDVLRTHPMVIFGETICKNHFYVPPERLLKEDPTVKDEVEHLLESIQKREQVETAMLRTEKLAAVGRMAATVAHEINNPLEAVTNLIYLAKTCEDRDSSREFLDQADAELRRISNLTRKTLAFYRDSGAPGRYKVENVIQDVLSLLKPKARSKGITVTVNVTDVEATGREGEIRQVLVNLISNALDAVDCGGDIHIRARVVGKGCSERVRLRVADSGNGMEPHQRARIFEPFFTTKPHGNGLGLWVTRELIQGAGGSIRVKSRRTTPSGTMFVVEFPLKASRAASVAS